MSDDFITCGDCECQDSEFGCSQLSDTKRCESFGSPDGMDGSCHYCSEDNKDLFERCIEYSDRDIKPKKVKEETSER